MRISHLLGKKKNKQSGWYQAVVTPERKLDLIDDIVISMARSIRYMNERRLPFSETAYSILISEYSRCAQLNWALTPTQRSSAIRVLKSGSTVACLGDVLRQATKK